ncbi:SgcJ/EcaC family oxidoreductase [Acinetobacter dispersus]|uniref:SgcJ/EcaC family oxidoreductase n=1 Tax=Acinetobacter dispersus TaxID=70348 RepID=UPI00132EADDF|nr:SgcJ/EcaC family oxidoreductase [Acinetobacter dispersus]QHH96976.1 SgcJ/EcaC family oxidoreductase [Acinetobacter dispersus]
MAKATAPKQIPYLFQMAWNEHDMAAFASLFCEDASFVNRFGHYVKGIEEIVALHRPIHETIYRDSTLQNEIIELSPITDDVVIIHFWSRLTAGTTHPAGPHQVDTLILAVLTKQQESWLIRALENVTLTNPRTGEAILRDD